MARGQTRVGLSDGYDGSQWQTNWVIYRSTAEALKPESSAGPYATADRRRALAERLEGLIS